MTRNEFTLIGKKLIKDGAKCALCGGNENLEAHHKVPRVFIDEDIDGEWNMVILCEKCHEKAHKIMVSKSECTKYGIRKVNKTQPAIGKITLLKLIHENDLTDVGDVIELIIRMESRGTCYSTKEERHWSPYEK